MTVFDRYKYDESGYTPALDAKVQAASVDHNKIVSPLSPHVLRLTVTDYVVPRIIRGQDSLPATSDREPPVLGKDQ